jgi:hypothetical protein
MGNPARTRGRNVRGRDVAALSLIPIRPSDQTVTSRSKLRDLTELLKRVGTMSNCSPAQRNDTAQAVGLAPINQRAVALPEPYLGSEAEISATYVVGIASAVEPVTLAPTIKQASHRPYYDLRTADELYSYWDELRGQWPLPLLPDLDRACIAISWPNTLLLTYGPDPSGMPEINRLSRFTGAVEASSLVTEWIISSSRQAVHLRKAMETERTFSSQISRRYYMMLLPFASVSGVSDSVLCHISCVG